MRRRSIAAIVTVLWMGQLVGAARAQDPNTNLVAYWPLNDGNAGETVTVADDVVDDPGHPATNAVSTGSGGTWFEDPGRGIVYRTVQGHRLSAATQGITTNFTWSLWVKILEDSSGTIMGTRAGNPWNKLTPTGLNNWAGVSGWNLGIYTPWHHMAVRGRVNEGGADQKVEVFLDGVLKGTDNNTASLTFNGALQFGGNDSWSEDIGGLMSDVAIWNEALDTARIQLLAAGGDVIVSNTNAPVIADLNPTHGATGVELSSDLAATFDQDILAWDGNVVITNLTASNAIVIPIDDAQVSIDGPALTINPVLSLHLGDVHAVLIEPTAIRNGAGTYFSGITNTSTWRFTASQADTTSPTLTSVAPTNNATFVQVDESLTASFTEQVILTAGGIITLTNLTDGTVTNITLPDFQVSTSVLDVVINPDMDLDHGDTYAVLIAPNAVADVFTNHFAGITNTATWRFTTDARPSVTALSPTNNAVDLRPTVRAMVTFDETVTLVDGGVITLTNLTSGTATNITLPDDQVSAAGNELTVIPSVYLSFDSTYAVLIDSNAVADVNGNAFLGINDPAVWRFRVMPEEVNWSLVAYWPLNDGPVGMTVTNADDLIDDPGFPETDATGQGDTHTWVDDAQRGIVYRTTQDNRLQAGRTEMNRDFTWSVWAKSVGTSAGVLMGTRYGNYTRLYLTGVSGSYVSFDYPDFNDGDWHHMVFRRKADIFSVYVDGTQKGSREQAAGDNNMQLEIGGAVRYREDFDGYMSDAAIWVEALTEERIAALAAGAPVDPQNPRAPPGMTLIVR
jgi:hypothetical protein